MGCSVFQVPLGLKEQDKNLSALHEDSKKNNQDDGQSALNLATAIAVIEGIIK